MTARSGRFLRRGDTLASAANVKQGGRERSHPLTIDIVDRCAGQKAQSPPAATAAAQNAAKAAPSMIFSPSGRSRQVAFGPARLMKQGAASEITRARASMAPGAAPMRSASPAISVPVAGATDISATW